MQFKPLNYFRHKTPTDLFNFYKTCSERRLTGVISWPKPTWRPAVPGQSHLQSSAQKFSLFLFFFIAWNVTLWFSKCRAYNNIPLQNTWNASSADLTSTSIQPATYMLWFWSSRRILDWGGLDWENKIVTHRIKHLFWGGGIKIAWFQPWKIIKHCVWQSTIKSHTQQD